MIRLKSILFLSLFSAVWISSARSDDPSEIEIAQGRLVGRRMQSVQDGVTYYSYRSVPYGEPPVGSLRFQLPVPHNGWEGLFLAKKSKTACAHYIQTYELNPNYFTGEEDCLYLTVHTPAPGTDLENLPIAVYLYNDFFRSGLTKIEKHNPDYFIEEGIIVIIIHHRLSSLGFLNFEDGTIPANLGLKDIVLGLKWIQKNVRAFGGDPDNVTLFGISSGAVAAEMLLHSEKAKGLFNKIIANSDSIYNSVYYPRTPRKNAFSLGKRLEKDAVTSRSLVRELLTIEAKDIQQKEMYVLNGDDAKFIQNGIIPMSPSIEIPSEHALLLKKPEDGLPEIDIPIMTGFCNRGGIKYAESYLIRPPLLTYAERDLPFNFPLRNDYRFEPYEISYINIIKDIKDFYFEDGKVKVDNVTEIITYLGDLLNGFAINHGVKEYASHSKAPVYYYVFGFDGELNFAKKKVWGTARTFDGIEGANTGDDLCYLFVCSKHRKIYEKLHSLEDPPKEIQMIRRMVRLWSNFIKTGNPTPSEDDPILEGFKWQPATAEELYFLNITEKAELILDKDPRKQFFDFWYEVVDHYRQYVGKDRTVDDDAFKRSMPGFDEEADRLEKQNKEEARKKIEEEAKNSYIQRAPQLQADENGSISATIPDKPVELKNFAKLCEQRRKFAVLYKLEFQTAVKVETHSCRHATKKTNLEKNQNQKVIPYDYNRVVLSPIDREPDSDYVNASYIDSLLKPNAYIVTQGPTEETVTDFWRMIWQERAAAIVMLTKTFDFIKVMCVQYWPASRDKDETYGDISVGVVQEEELANFHIRTFRLYKKEGEAVVEERFILQFHYTQWHSHTCPFANALLEFRRRVRAVVGRRLAPHSGPMLVHCNDGGGRSGVYLAVDANLELAEEEDAFDVFGYLKKLRQSRKGLIENVDQYKFVYDTLEEHVICGVSWFPVSELSQRLKQKSVRDPVSKLNEYQREYAQICKQTPRFTIGDCAGGHRGDNREKNRDVLVVPPDNFRPYLTSFQGNSFTDYINAVFVDTGRIRSLKNRRLCMRNYTYVIEGSKISILNDSIDLYQEPADSIGMMFIGMPNINVFGICSDRMWQLAPASSIRATRSFRAYLIRPIQLQTSRSGQWWRVYGKGYTKPREYIVTEWPLRGTCGEFWSLVYDYECAAVVVLCVPPKHSQQFPAFWPEGRHSKKYGPVFTIDHVSHNHYTNIKTWVFRINKKIVSLTELMAGVKAPPKTVQLFQLTCWPMGHKVPTSTNSLVELMNMVERWRQRTEYGPVCVVSPDGRSRAGVYCAANACIEQVIQHGEVDIFQAVKTVRRHRPQLVENMTEYKYCYDLVLHYVLHYLNKDMKEKK